MTKRQHEDTTIAKFYNCGRAKIANMRESNDYGRNRTYIAMCKHYRDIMFPDRIDDPRDKIKA